MTFSKEINYMVTYNVSLENKVVLVTGAAGFIGANLVKRLLNESDSVKVIGIDSITEYYDVADNSCKRSYFKPTS